MGTSQDWRVAVEEGATLIRVGRLCSEAGSRPGAAAVIS